MWSLSAVVLIPTLPTRVNEGLSKFRRKHTRPLHARTTPWGYELSASFNAATLRKARYTRERPKAESCDAPDLFWNSLGTAPGSPSSRAPPGIPARRAVPTAHIRRKSCITRMAAHDSSPPNRGLVAKGEERGCSRPCHTPRCSWFADWGSISPKHVAQRDSRRGPIVTTQPAPRVQSKRRSDAHPSKRLYWTASSTMRSAQTPHGPGDRSPPTEIKKKKNKKQEQPCGVMRG